MSLSCVMIQLSCHQSCETSPVFPSIIRVLCFVPWSLFSQSSCRISTLHYNPVFLCVSPVRLRARNCVWFTFVPWSGACYVTKRFSFFCPLKTLSAFTSLQFCLYDFSWWTSLSAALCKCSALFVGQFKACLVCEISSDFSSRKYWRLFLNHFCLLALGCGTYTTPALVIGVFVVCVSSLPC